MPLLLEEDYARLDVQGVRWREIPERRFLIFEGFPLPARIYTADKASILVIIEARYPEAGHDMFWTAPRLVRADGAAIPQTADSGSSCNHKVGDVEYHRWSRHWFEDMASRWVPGKSNVDTILQRITWALQNQPLI